VLDDDGEGSEQESAQEDPANDFDQGVFFKSPGESQGDGRTHGEEEERKDDIDPGDAEGGGADLVSGRGLLGVVHPRGEPVPGDTPRQAHPQQGESSQGVKRGEPAHLYGILRLHIEKQLQLFK